MAEENKEVTLERLYNAPAEKVWMAWTDPEQLKKWWGPENVTIPECEVDLKIGGRLYLVMEATEAMGEYKGMRWPMDAKFTVVEPNSKLVYEAKAWTEGDQAATTIETVQELSLKEEGGKTKLYLKATLNKIGPKAGMAAEGMKHGYSEQLDKLDKFLRYF
jgi:uncharacterized protein YndB with AHSA1/START domain